MKVEDNCKFYIQDNIKEGGSCTGGCLTHTFHRCKHEDTPIGVCYYEGDCEQCELVKPKTNFKEFTCFLLFLTIFIFTSMLVSIITIYTFEN